MKPLWSPTNACFLMLALLSAPLLADQDLSEEVSPWTLRAHGMGSTYSRQQGTVYSGHRTELTLRDPIGFEASIEYRQHRYLGWGLAVGMTRLQAENRGWRQVPDFSASPPILRWEERPTLSGYLLVRPVTFGPTLYWPLGGSVTPYLGFQVAWVGYRVDRDVLAGRDSELGFGGKLGLEWHRSESPWSVQFEARHLRTEFDLRDQRQLYRDLKLTLFSIGLGYGF